MSHSNQSTFENLNYSYDYAMTADVILSSVLTHDATMPLLFSSKPDLQQHTHPLSNSHSNLLTTLKSLPTVNMLNVININSSSKLSRHDTVILIQS